MSEATNEIFSYINSQLHTNTKQSINIIKTIINDKEIMQLCKKYPQYIFLFLALDIYYSEIAILPFECTILHQMYCLDDIQALLTQYKHLIFNIDFDVDRIEAINSIKQALRNKEISIIAIKYLIEHMSFNKETTYKFIFN